eukprot:32407-Eustigmatos_ZCMA.PRE.1
MPGVGGACAALAYLRVLPCFPGADTHDATTAGITTMARNKATGELSLAQQFRVDQRQGITDIEGM